MVLFTRFRILCSRWPPVSWLARIERIAVLRKGLPGSRCRSRRTREEEAARRVEEERVRIAREVHDITAHSLSAVSIQAAAAERMIDRDPAAAKEAISAVRTTAKGALADIRSMIGVLRCGDDAAETSPGRGPAPSGWTICVPTSETPESKPRSTRPPTVVRTCRPTWTWRCSASPARLLRTSCGHAVRARRSSAWPSRTDGRVWWWKTMASGAGSRRPRPHRARCPRLSTERGTALPAWPSACTCWAARFRRAIEPAAASAWLPACR